MTKADLIETLAEEHEMSRRKVAEMIDMLLDEIRTALQKGDKVALTPFGSFVVRSRKKREGRNPKTGETIMIPARKVPAFQAGKALKDAVSGAKKSAGRSGGAKKSGGRKKGGRKR